MAEKKHTPEENHRVARLLRGPEDEAFAGVKGRREGLTAAESAARLEEFGYNSVTARRPSPCLEFLRKFKEPLVIQLVTICILSYVFEENQAQAILEASVVGGMVFLSVFLSFFQENRSAQAIAKLQAMVKSTCDVLREGVEVTVPIDEIVPGDVVILAAGSIISGRLPHPAGQGLLPLSVGADRRVSSRRARGLAWRARGDLRPGMSQRLPHGRQCPERFRPSAGPRHRS